MTDFAVGDLVQFKNGRKFVLEDVNDNPHWKEEGETFAFGSDGGGYNNVDVWDPSDIQLVMDAEEAAKRTPPTPVELEPWLGSALINGRDDIIDAHTTEVQGDGSVLVEAETADGLEISFMVRIESVYVN